MSTPYELVSDGAVLEIYHEQDDTLIEVIVPGPQGPPGHSKFAASVGDGSATQYDVTHNLGTRDIVVTVARVAAPYEVVLCDIERLDTNTVRVRFGTAPTTNQFRVTVMG